MRKCEEMRDGTGIVRRPFMSCRPAAPPFNFIVLILESCGTKAVDEAVDAHSVSTIHFCREYRQLCRPSTVDCTVYIILHSSEALHRVVIISSFPLFQLSSPVNDMALLPVSAVCRLVCRTECPEQSERRVEKSVLTAL